MSNVCEYKKEISVTQVSLFIDDYLKNNVGIYSNPCPRELSEIIVNAIVKGYISNVNYEED